MNLYILSFFISVTILGFVGQFIHIKKFNHKPYIKNFISSVVILSLLIACFAIYITKAKTIFIAYFLIILFFILKKDITLKNIKKKDLKPFILMISFSIPIYLIQLYLNLSFTENKPLIPSDDIFIYASYSKHLVEFGEENKFAMFSKIYPDLFSGTNPYHFYEIWTNSLVTKFNNQSYTYNFIYVSYPLLLWVFLNGIFALGEYFNLVQLKYKFYLFTLLFFGPLYFSTYSFIFNDGNLFNSAVFTIPGFVKQTLCFSYFGQKHLPVYIFSILFILLFIYNYTKGAVLTLHGLITASFGVFPGIYSGIMGLYSFHLKKNYKFILIFLISSLILFFGLIQLNPLGVSKEISEKTFYFNYFLQELNWKGELLRVFQKLVYPAIWLSILYIPIISVIALNLDTISKEIKIKQLLLFVCTSYLGGALFTLIVDGLNTDQFITNLLPVYNVISIFIFIFLLKTNRKEKKKKIVLCTILALTIIQNSLFCIGYFKNFNETINNKYDEKIQKKLVYHLRKSKPKYIAYLLSEQTIKKNHPMHQCIYYPAKFLFINNFFNYLNINYPYQTYPKNSTFHVFAPYNQMRYFIENKKVEFKNFEKEQFKFLKRNHIEWIMCEKNAYLPQNIQKRVLIDLSDPISKERYYRINLY